MTWWCMIAQTPIYEMAPSNPCMTTLSIRMWNTMRNYNLNTKAITLKYCKIQLEDTRAS